MKKHRPWVTKAHEEHAQRTVQEVEAEIMARNARLYPPQEQPPSTILGALKPRPRFARLRVSLAGALMRLAYHLLFPLWDENVDQDNPLQASIGCLSVAKDLLPDNERND